MSPIRDKKEDVCSHMFYHLGTDQHFDKSGYGSYIRIDLFFCQKCLKIEERKKEYYLKAGEIHKPDWYFNNLVE